MVEIVLLILFVGIAFFLSRLRTVYTSIPVSELSHRSREGDTIARQLHQVAKYGRSVNIVFWSLIVLVSAGSVLISSKVFDDIWNYLFYVVFLSVIFLAIPNTRALKICVTIATKISPQVAKILSSVSPGAKVADSLLTRFIPSKGVSISREEATNFFKGQKTASRPVLEAQQVEAVLHILQSDHKRIKDVMLPFDSVRVVSAADAIGPILIDELHKIGQGWFPVRQPKKKNIIGFFYIHDLLAHAEGGKISDVMDEELFYIHEKQPLWALLDAFIQTKSQIFLAINENQKIVGIVSVEAVLTKLLGNLELAGGESYDDPETVALY